MGAKSRPNRATAGGLPKREITAAAHRLLCFAPAGYFKRAPLECGVRYGTGLWRLGRRSVKLRSHKHGPSGRPCSLLSLPQGPRAVRIVTGIEITSHLDTALFERGAESSPPCICGPLACACWLDGGLWMADREGVIIGQCAHAHLRFVSTPGSSVSARWTWEMDVGDVGQRNRPPNERFSF